MFKLWKWPASQRALERDEIRASAEDELRDMQNKRAALDATIEALLRNHVEGKSHD